MHWLWIQNHLQEKNYRQKRSNSILSCLICSIVKNVVKQLCCIYNNIKLFQFLLFKLIMLNILPQMSRTVVYAVLLGINFILFLLTLFTPQTIILGVLCIVLTFNLIRGKIYEILHRGLTAFLPEKLRKQLRQRSLFDFLCDFWYMEYWNIVKVCIKPLFGQIQPENAVEILDELTPETKQKFLKKNVFQIMPRQCKDLLCEQDIENETDYLSIQKQIEKQELVQNCLSAHSLKLSRRSSQVTKRKDKSMKMRNNYNMIQLCESKPSFLSEFSSNSQLAIEYPKTQQYIPQKKQTKARSEKHQWDKIKVYKSFIKKANKEGFFQTARNTLAIVRNLIQLKNISKNIKKANSFSMIKMMVFFWMLMVVQVKLSPHSRRVILRILYLMVGVATVIGVIGSSTMLMYKFYTIENIRKSQSKINQLSSK